MLITAQNPTFQKFNSYIVSRRLDTMEFFRGDDGLCIRRARKQWTCWGNGALRKTKHADGCVGKIQMGETYMECLWEAPSYQSGTRHSMPCARAFFRKDVPEAP